MKNFYPDSDIRYIYDLINLASKLAITPPLHESKEKLAHFKYYGLAVIAIILTGALTSLYGIVVHFVPIFKVTSVVLRFCCTIALSTMSIMAILVAMVNGDTWTTFMDLFQCLDLKLNKGNILEKRNFMQMELLLWHFLVFCIFAYDGYVWYSTYGWSFFRFCIFRYVNMLGVDNTRAAVDVPHDFRTTFFFAALCLILILFHGRVVLYCEEINNESRNTLTICYNLQQAVDPLSSERRELIILTEVICLLKTRTNAAGFYFINRSLMSRVFGYLISYSIVLIQFNKQG